TRFSRDWSSDVCSSDLETGEIPDQGADVQTSSDEAKKVLEESSMIASQQMKERFPELPTPEPRQTAPIAKPQAAEPRIPIAVTSGGIEEEPELPLEERVLDYIKSHNGELSLNSASEELAVPADDIRGSLQKLKDDGKIVMD